MAKPHEINDAYFQGLRELGPDAEHDALEFGIPYGEPAKAEHVQAGREVAAVLAIHDNSVDVPDTSRQNWIDSMHLTGPIPYKTPEARAATSARVADLKSRIFPFGERPDTEQ